MAIFPGFFDMSALGIWDAVAILCVTLPIGFASDCAYAAAAAKAGQLLRNESAIRNVNIGTGSVMIGAGALIAGSP